MWRYEIKYVLHHHEWLQLQQALVLHPASFRTAFPDRIVNNIYLDTTDFIACNDNLAGISDRRKYRIRWYGKANEIKNPVLEIKIKNNALGRKEIRPITDWENDLMDNKFLAGYGGLTPVLQNQYLRSYYLNWEGNFRLTVDRNIKYKSATGLLSTNYDDALLDEHIIIELKFKEEDLKYHQEISKYLPFRPSKHSKYVTGVFYCFNR